MREFRVTLTNRHGELARLTEILSKQGINLKSVAAISEGSKAVICLVADDTESARAALQEARIPFEENELLSELMENEPGKLDDLAGRLAGAGINILSLYILGREDPLIEVGFTVDEPKKAKKLLSGN